MLLERGYSSKVALILLESSDHLFYLALLDYRHRRLIFILIVIIYRDFIHMLVYSLRPPISLFWFLNALRLIGAHSGEARRFGGLNIAVRLT